MSTALSLPTLKWLNCSPASSRGSSADLVTAAAVSSGFPMRDGGVVLVRDVVLFSLHVGMIRMMMIVSSVRTLITPSNYVYGTLCSISIHHLTLFGQQ